MEGLQVSDLKIASLLFADDVVLMASSAVDLQRSLDRLTAECEAAGMRISTSKSEAMVLSRKPVDCLLRVGNECLPQVKELKCLRVLFMSEGMMRCQIGLRVGAAGAVLHALHRTIVTKRELSRKAKLSIYGSNFVPTLTYCCERWVMTQRMKLRVQAAEMGSLRRVAGVSLRDRVRSLKAKLSQCSFFQKEVHYLGHMVSGEGVSSDPSKIEVVANWPFPTTVSELHFFLGFASYYQCFVEGFAKLAAPLQKAVAKFGCAKTGKKSEHGVIRC